MVVCHLVKADSGGTAMLYIDGRMADVFSYYSTGAATETEFSLRAFCRKGDEIRIHADSQGSSYKVAMVLVQRISWFG